jgi:hypothetical protein
MSMVSMLTQTNPVHAIPPHFCTIHHVLHFSNLKEFNCTATKLLEYKILTISLFETGSSLSMKHIDNMHWYLQHSTIMLTNNIWPATKKKLNKAENPNVEFEFFQ